MWIFTQNGFTSVVQCPDNADFLVVRFRVEEDANNFACLLHTTPVRTPDRDYGWRVLVTKATFKKMLAKMVDRIDYHNFKDRIHEEGNQLRNQTYMEVWGSMFNFQVDTIELQIERGVNY